MACCKLLTFPNCSWTSSLCRYQVASSWIFSCQKMQYFQSPFNHLVPHHWPLTTGQTGLCFYPTQNSCPTWHVLPTNIFNDRKTQKKTGFQRHFFRKPRDQCFHPTKPSHIILLPHVFPLFFRAVFAPKSQVIFYFIGAMNFTSILALQAFKERHIGVHLDPRIMKKHEAKTSQIGYTHSWFEYMVHYVIWYILYTIHPNIRYMSVYIYIYYKKSNFRQYGQMKSRAGQRQGEEKSRREKMIEEKESEERRCRCAKR